MGGGAGAYGDVARAGAAGHLRPPDHAPIRRIQAEQRVGAEVAAQTELCSQRVVAVRVRRLLADLDRPGEIALGW